jgi:hypothetical protein
MKGMHRFTLVRESVSPRSLGPLRSFASCRSFAAGRALAWFGLGSALAGCGAESADESLGQLALSTSMPAGAAISVGLPGSFALGSVAVAARGSLSIADRARVQGAAGGYAKVVNLGRGTTDLGVEGWVGDVVSHGTVNLRERANVAGSVRSAQDIATHANVNVSGATLEHTRIERATERAWVATFPQNAPNVTLFSGQSRSLAPGDHGSVTVNAGAKLTLRSGTYNIASLKLEPSSTLIVNSSAGPVLLNVRSELIFRGVLQNRSSVADDLLIGYLGTNMATLEAPFGGTLVAPNARIKLGGLNGAQQYGALFGHDIEIHPDARFKHVPFAHWDDVPLLFDGSEPAARVPFDLGVELVGGSYEVTYRPVSPLLPDLDDVVVNVVPTLPPGDHWLLGGGVDLIPCQPSSNQGQNVLSCTGLLSDRPTLHEVVTYGIDRVAALERLIEIIECQRFGCPSTLGEEFRLNPRYDLIKQHLRFQTVGASYDRSDPAIKPPWSEWSTSRDEFPNQPEFGDALEEAWDWLHAADRFTDLQGQLETALTETGHENPDTGSENYLIEPQDAWELYVNWVAHNVALDRKRELAWTLADLAAIDDGLLAPLLDSTEMMGRGIFEPHYYRLGSNYHFNYEELPVGSYLGATIIGQPRYTYRFIAQNAMAQSTRVDSIGALIEWSRRMFHFIGEGSPENNMHHWGHTFFPTVEDIVEGTLGDSDEYPHHWTLGCHGTAQFMKDVLRAINIPVRIPALCRHATVEFSSEGLYLDHGDDPYDFRFKDSACHALDLLLPHDVFWERFGHEGTNHNDPVYCEAEPSPVNRIVEELECAD